MRVDLDLDTREDSTLTYVMLISLSSSLSRSSLPLYLFSAHSRRVFLPKAAVKAKNQVRRNSLKGIPVHRFRTRYEILITRHVRYGDSRPVHCRDRG